MFIAASSKEDTLIRVDLSTLQWGNAQSHCPLTNNFLRTMIPVFRVQQKARELVPDCGTSRSRVIKATEAWDVQELYGLPRLYMDQLPRDPTLPTYVRQCAVIF